MKKYLLYAAIRHKREALRVCDIVGDFETKQEAQDFFFDMMSNNSDREPIVGSALILNHSNMEKVAETVSYRSNEGEFRVDWELEDKYMFHP